MVEEGPPHLQARIMSLKLSAVSFEDRLKKKAQIISYSTLALGL
jgi:hypothetical protein